MKKSSIFFYLSVPIIVVLGLFLLIFFLTKRPAIAETKTVETTQQYLSPTFQGKELLEPMAEGYVGPNKEWITPEVQYKFKFRAEGHAMTIQFSNGKGGWIKPVTYPTEGDFYMPPEAKSGPVKVTAGPNETKEFRVQLYKRIQN